MPTVSVYNMSRDKVGEVNLDDSVFGAEVKEHLFYAVVRHQMAERRAGTHSTKSRSEVSGGGKKPWKQKGTGRARQGTTRAPHWRGGGVVFGPKPRSHAFKLNKKVRRSALCGALTRRVQENALFVIDELTLPEIKTRQVIDFMKRFDCSELLVVLPAHDETFARSARNIEGVKVLLAEGLNVYDILNHKNVVISRPAIDAVTARLSG
jgi:large subunit ribosomal protein L4